jgi:photosystem II stability/assembly factor-like uncharacterized protein
MQIPAESRDQATTRQRGRGMRATPALITSADGSTFMLMTRTPVITRNRGKTWTTVDGLYPGARPVADRADPNAFYTVDFKYGQVYRSGDTGASFAPVRQVVPLSNIKSDEPTWHEAPWPLMAAPGRAGNLWFVGKEGLFRSIDGGESFARVENSEGVQINALSFGKAPPGGSDPTLFAIGTLGRLKAIWRSDDLGKSWIRINDDLHQYGTRFRCLSGDPRVFGQVFVGTDGRGVFCATPATSRAQE